MHNIKIPFQVSTLLHDSNFGIIPIKETITQRQKVDWGLPGAGQGGGAWWDGGVRRWKGVIV